MAYLKTFVGLLVVCAVVRAEFDDASVIASEFNQLSQYAQGDANQLLPGQDTVTLINDANPSGGGAGGLDVGEDSSDHDKDAAMLEPLNAKLKAVDMQMSKARGELKAARKAALRMVLIQAKLKALEAKKEKIMITKKKIILENRLDHQTQDLNGIDRMAETLRDKFSDLQHTQQVLQESIDGTRSGLSYLAQMSPGIPKGPQSADGARIIRSMAGAHSDEMAGVTGTQNQNQDALVHQLANLLKTTEDKLQPSFVEVGRNTTMRH